MGNVKLSVNITQENAEKLADRRDVGGRTVTGQIQEALELYWFLLEAWKSGNKVLIEDEEQHLKEIWLLS